MSLTGSIIVSGDKSITHRAIIFSSLSKGQTKIYHPLLGEDCLSTLAIFNQFGVTHQLEENCLIITSPGMEQFNDKSSVLDAGNSGTTARLLMGVLATLKGTRTLVGDASLSKRPMKRVTQPLSLMGANIKLANDATLPATITGTSLKGISYELPVASAQVKSALMLAGMLADGMTTISEPIPTRDHTEKMFEEFQIVYNKQDRVITINGNQMPKTPGELTVPGDISSAAFFMVAALLIPGSDIVIKNVGINETRAGIIDVIKAMNGQIECLNQRLFGQEPVADIRVRYTKELVATTIEGALIPRLIDEIPILALLATRASGETVIKDAEELKVKETNRIDVTVKQLQTIGAKIKATSDGMIITGNKEGKFIANPVRSHKDHRIAMMLYIASLLMDEDLVIEDLESMAISYPDFLNHLNELLKN